jgi:hypothetical protein
MQYLRYRNLPCLIFNQSQSEKKRVCRNSQKQDRFDLALKAFPSTDHKFIRLLHTLSSSWTASEKERELTCHYKIKRPTSKQEDPVTWRTNC